MSTGSRNHFEQSERRRQDLHLTGDLVDEEDELVAAQSRGEIVGPDARAQSVGDGHQQSVATGVAQEVVHDLEPVEVDDHDRGVATRLETVHQLLDEGAAVRQSGQVVVVRVEDRLLLGVDARLGVARASTRPPGAR